MTLIEQYHAKQIERAAFVESQSRLHMNLREAIDLVDVLTTTQLEQMDASIRALAATIGLTPNAEIKEAAE